MTSALITKTINPLPFVDLKPSRFEDLCLGVVFRMRIWKSIKHHGRKGKERGVDIYTELDSEGELKRWFIQCKNYQSIKYSQLKAIIDDVVSRNNNLPDEYLLILSCDVSRDDWEKLQVYAKQKGLLSIDLISGSVLETMLYSRHHDLLYIFFGLDIMNKRNNMVTQVKRRLALKKKFEAEYWAKKPHEMIVRDVHNDSLYPENEYNKSIGISSWFKAEILRPYHRGISLIIGIESIQINPDGGWQVVKYGAEQVKGATYINALVIGNVPYDSVVAIDFDGDEYYHFPHLYCEFSFSGQPYEKIWYEPTSDYKQQILWLAEDKQIISGGNKMWFVYILRCVDSSLYTGITTDLERRLKEHNSGTLGSKYTRAKRPVELVYQETVQTRSEALKREAVIKKLSKEEKEQLIAQSV